jgi:hypothetical protein
MFHKFPLYLQIFFRSLPHDSIISLNEPKCKLYQGAILKNQGFFTQASSGEKYSLRMKGILSISLAIPSRDLIMPLPGGGELITKLIHFS